MKRIKINQKGFTLIELLIVISIIGLLSALAVLAFGDIRMKARDSKRLHDFNQLQTALEIFYNKYGVYPCGDSNDATNGGTGDSTLSPGFLNGGTVANCLGNPTTGLADANIINSDDIKDPKNSWGSINYCYHYLVTYDRQAYILITYLEANDQLMINDDGFCNDNYEIGPGVGILDPGGFVGPPGCL